MSLLLPSLLLTTIGISYAVLYEFLKRVLTNVILLSSKIRKSPISEAFCHGSSSLIAEATM